MRLPSTRARRACPRPRAHSDFRHRPRLRLRQPAVGRPRARTCRRGGHPLVEARGRDGRRRVGRPWCRRVRRVHAGAAVGVRARDHRASPGGRSAGARHLCGHADPLRARASSTASSRRDAASGPVWSSGCRRPSYPTWDGTPSTSPRARSCSPGIEDERFYFVHSYGVRDWTLRTNNRTHAPAGDLGRARGRPVRRGGRERAARGHAVPPGEVRGRGRAAVAQLGGWALNEQGAGSPTRGARARGGDRPCSTGAGGREARASYGAHAGTDRTGPEATLATDRRARPSASAARSGSPSPW